MELVMSRGFSHGKPGRMGLKKCSSSRLLNNHSSDRALEACMLDCVDCDSECYFPARELTFYNWK